MNKQDRIKGVIEELINSDRFNNFNKQDIEKAIVRSRQPLDERTIQNWFRLLWKLEYITQPKPNTYSLNITKLEELEVIIPPEVADPNQRRLS